MHCSAITPQQNRNAFVVSPRSGQGFACRDWHEVPLRFPGRAGLACTPVEHAQCVRRQGGPGMGASSRPRSHTRNPPGSRELGPSREPLYLDAKNSSVSRIYEQNYSSRGDDGSRPIPLFVLSKRHSSSPTSNVIRPWWT